MRQILFRGLKHFPYGNAWYIGDLWHCQGEPYIRTDKGGSFSVVPGTVGQYIGRNDKTNRMIFEGDIARYEHITQYGKLEIGDPFEIRWNENECNFCAWDEYTFIALPPFDRLRVIGNIHETNIYTQNGNTD